MPPAQDAARSECSGANDRSASWTSDWKCMCICAIGKETEHAYGDKFAATLQMLCMHCVGKGEQSGSHCDKTAYTYLHACLNNTSITQQGTLSWRRCEGASAEWASKKKLGSGIIASSASALKYTTTYGRDPTFSISCASHAFNLSELQHTCTSVLRECR